MLSSLHYCNNMGGEGWEYSPPSPPPPPHLNCYIPLITSLFSFAFSYRNICMACLASWRRLDEPHETTATKSLGLINYIKALWVYALNSPQYWAWEIPRYLYAAFLACAQVVDKPLPPPTLRGRTNCGFPQFQGGRTGIAVRGRSAVLLHSPPLPLMRGRIWWHHGAVL